MIKLILYISLFTLYFFLHYIEGISSDGAFSVAQLWKIPILMVLVIYVLKTKRNFDRFETWGYAYSMSPFLCPAILTNPFLIFVFSVKQLPLVLFYNFWLRFNAVVLEKLLLIFAQFISITSVITLLKIIEPLKEYKSAAGHYQDAVYYTSVFGTAHSASSYFCVSIIVLLYFFINGKFKTKFEKIFNSILLVISLYSIYLAYVRTGWLMLFVSLMFIVNIKKISVKQKVRVFIGGLIVGLGIWGLYSNDEAFRNRISGSSVARGESGQVIDTKGSGRIEFWKNGWDNWSSGNFYQLCFGKGDDSVAEYNYKRTGMKVFSHNQFVDSLAKYGLFCLLFLVLFYFSIYKYIKRFGNGSSYKNLCYSVLSASLIFSFFQNEMYWDFALIFSICLALLIKDARESRQKKFIKQNDSE